MTREVGIRVALVLLTSFLVACDNDTSGGLGGSTSAPVATPFVPRAARTVPPVPTAPGSEPTQPPDSADVRPGPVDRFWVVEMTAHDDDAGDDVPLTVALARLGALTVQTAANANCIASGKLPSGALITSGLGAKRANSTGTVSWSFAAVVTERGTGSYTLTCGAGPNLHTVMAFFWIQ